MGWGDLWSNIQEGASDLYEDAKGAVDSGSDWLNNTIKNYGGQSVNPTDEAAFGESVEGFSDKNRDFLISQYDRMNMGDSGISEQDFIDNMYKFSQDTRMMESSGDITAENSKSSAKGLYQFTDESVGTAKNRMSTGGWESNETNMDKGGFDWGVDDENNNYISSIGEDPRLWSPEQSDSMFLANMFAQSGSDEYLKRVGTDEYGANKEAYYKFHHTDPDIATTEVADEIYGGYEDLGAQPNPMYGGARYPQKEPKPENKPVGNNSNINMDDYKANY